MVNHRHLPCSPLSCLLFLPRTSHAAGQACIIRATCLLEWINFHPECDSHALYTWTWMRNWMRSTKHIYIHVYVSVCHPYIFLQVGNSRDKCKEIHSTSTACEKKEFSCKCNKKRILKLQTWNFILFENVDKKNNHTNWNHIFFYFKFHLVFYECCWKFRIGLGASATYKVHVLKCLI